MQKKHDKIPYSFIINLSGKERNFFHLIKYIYSKPLIDIILNGECFPLTPRLGTNEEYLLSPLLLIKVLKFRLGTKGRKEKTCRLERK